MSSSPSKVIWTLGIRTLHWCVAVCVILNLLVLEEGDPPHTWAGYVACFFVGLRLHQGFFGKSHALFRNFPFFEIAPFLKDFFRSDAKPYEGHNPMASWTYVGIWFLIFCLGLSGYLMSTDYFFGEESMQKLHEILSQCLVALILAHFAGILTDAWKHKRKTWLAMITGRR